MKEDSPTATALLYKGLYGVWPGSKLEADLGTLTFDPDDPGRFRLTVDHMFGGEEAIELEQGDTLFVTVDIPRDARQEPVRVYWARQKEEK